METVPQNQRCEFIENSTELNRQKSCKNRIHSWLHAPLSLCTIYCSHQVRGWLVGVGGGGAGVEHSRGLLVVIQRYILFPQTFLSSVVLDPRCDPEGASVSSSSSSATCSQGTSQQRVPPWNMSCGARGAASPPSTSVATAEKSTDLRFRRVGWRHTYTHTATLYIDFLRTHIFTHRHTHIRKQTHTHPWSASKTGMRFKLLNKQGDPHSQTTSNTRLCRVELFSVKHGFCSVCHRLK